MSASHNRWLDEEDGDSTTTPTTTTTVINNITGGGVSNVQLTAAISAADHVRSIRTHPPLPLTGPVTQNIYGAFTLSASSQQNSSRYIRRAFDHQENDNWNAAWASTGMYNLTTGEYEGAAQLHPTTPLGEFVRFSMPYRISVQSFAILPAFSGHYLDSLPVSYRVYGISCHTKPHPKHLCSRPCFGALGERSIQRP